MKSFKLSDYKENACIGNVVYKITNSINNKCYIGITSNLKKRLKDHIRFSINNYKIKGYIHKSIQKYGVDKFTVEILCECETDLDLNEKEQYYIKLHNSANSDFGYNLTLGGNREIPNKETIEKKIKNSHKVKVAQYDLKGNLIKSYVSIKEASRELNISDSDIHRCHKKNWSRNNFMFKKYENIPLTKIKPYIDNKGVNLSKMYKGKNSYNSCKCQALNKITNETIYANSLLELAELLNIHKSTIFTILKNKKHKKWLISKEAN
jgi:group I intron endonuclease